MKKVKIGDIFEIPISEQRKAFGQLVFLDEKQGPLIQIFDLIADENEKFDPAQVVIYPLMFPPIISGVSRAVKKGNWKIIGNNPITEFIYPKFVSTLWDENSGKARVWFSWDGERYTKLGWELPKEDKSLEFLVVLNPLNVAKRIELGGEQLFPYKDLIEKNQYDPANQGT